ncbi:MAG: glycosyltransferase family 2 protein [Saprospiraceae bacterium]|jgi:cellulose synthase/poly-beta-1,6-N-acetylglucosamine synthase-like glycosyltransferase|nr:glycosyltransferase family 2 protein [Saprospiraceae bacterium]
MIAFKILTIALLAYLGWAVVYQLGYAIAGHFFKKEKGKADGKYRRFAVLIPAFREDAVIVDTVRATLRQNYPEQCFEVMPIADQIWNTTIADIKRLGVHPLQVAFDKSTKSKSINAALAQLGDDFDAVAVLDADNHPKHDFLLRMNEALGQGHQAVQGCRVAKHDGEGLSLLDGVSEAVNNHLLCSGHRALGLSARLAGSGMAFDFQVFKKVMASIDAIGGFDKELELKLTQQGVKIAYAPQAIVLDEKVDNAKTFARQRGRWLAAQYRYGKRFAGSAVRALVLEGRLDFFNKTLQMALPPRVVLPGVLAMGTVVSLVLQLEFLPIWAMLLAGNLLCFGLSIPRAYWNKQFLLSLLQLPVAFLSTLKALTLMRVAAKQFLHTPHGGMAFNNGEG